MRSGGLAWGLVLFMLAGGVYSLIIDKAWLGGGIWTVSALILLPPVQSFCAETLGVDIPEVLSLLIFVGGFIAGLLLI